MTFEEAVKNMIKQYFDDDFDDDELESRKLGGKESKYNKKYFDKFEEEILGERRMLASKGNK